MHTITEEMTRSKILPVEELAPVNSEAASTDSSSISHLDENGHTNGYDTLNSSSMKTTRPYMMGYALICYLNVFFFVNLINVRSICLLAA